MSDLLKQFIKEEINLFLQEYKTQFDWNTFKTIENKSGRLRYAKQSGLIKLGEGSSRAAYLLPNTNKVLKIALNTKGVGQNEAEMDIFTNPVTKPIITKIYDYDPEYEWLVSETAKELNNNKQSKELFEKIAGFPFEYVRNCFGEPNCVQDQIDYVKQDMEHSIKINDQEDVEWQKQKLETLNKIGGNNPYIRAIESLSQTGLLIGDVDYLPHWGVTSDGRLVLLDYGFTEQVHSKYYS